MSASVFSTNAQNVSKPTVNTTSVSILFLLGPVDACMRVLSMQDM